jgi:hypothetical protein
MDWEEPRRSPSTRPLAIHLDKCTHMLCVDTVLVALMEYVVGPGGISIVSPELFAMQFTPALDAA